MCAFVTSLLLRFHLSKHLQYLFTLVTVSNCDLLNNRLCTHTRELHNSRLILTQFKPNTLRRIIYFIRYLAVRFANGNFSSRYAKHRTAPIIFRPLFWAYSQSKYACIVVLSFIRNLFAVFPALNVHARLSIHSCIIPEVMHVFLDHSNSDYVLSVKPEFWMKCNIKFGSTYYYIEIKIVVNVTIKVLTLYYFLNIIHDWLNCNHTPSCFLSCSLVTYIYIYVYKSIICDFSAGSFPNALGIWNPR